jgi:O-acetyl-ADP-ribose deacetylase (regulator of RNase III)
MPIKNIIYGNLIQDFKDKKYDVIVHGCNTFGSFGAGIAKTIKEEFPEAYEVDLKAFKNKTNHLGTFSVASVGSGQTIVNMYTQETVGWNRIHDCPPVDYTAIYRGFLALNSVLLKASKQTKYFPTVGVPAIGAGLAKGDLEIIKSLINLATPDLNITLVLYKDSTK